MSQIEAFWFLERNVTVFVSLENVINHRRSWRWNIRASEFTVLEFLNPDLEFSSKYWISFQLFYNLFIWLLRNLRLKSSLARSRRDKHFLSDVEWFQKTLWIFNRTFINQIVDSFYEIFWSTSILFGWDRISGSQDSLYRWLLIHLED